MRSTMNIGDDKVQDPKGPEEPMEGEEEGLILQD
jgi:hypothetical protein